MYAAIHDGLRRNRRFAGSYDFLHHVPAVVMDEHHSRTATDSRLPSSLTDRRIRRSTDRFDKVLFLTIPDFDPEIVLCRF